MMADPVQQRRLEHQVFYKSCGNAEIVVRLAELLFRLQNRGLRQIAFLQPRVANSCNRGIKIMITIMKSVECENIPAGDFYSAQHTLADGRERVDFIQPSHGDTLARHEIVKSGNHDGCGPRGASSVTESMEPSKCGGFPAKPATGRHRDRIRPCLPRLI